MIRKVLYALILIALGWLSIDSVHAQTETSGLAITIARPGEGETLYSNPSAPFAAIPITGLVSANGIDLSQLQIRLDVLQGSQVTRSATFKPEKDGTFRIDVGVNPHPVSDQAELEIGCDSRCHSMQNLILPTGLVLLRVTVSDPLGHKAMAERSIVVDNSDYANLPVQVMLQGESGHTLAGVRVVADTRLYLWREREFSAVTDATGRATIHVERLSQAPTNYVLQIEPRAVDGAFVTSRVPVSVTIPAGATTLAPVIVFAQTQRGQIQGTIANFQNRSDVTVRAISLSSGAAFNAKTSQAKFALSNLPLDKYLVTMDDADAIAQGIQVEPQTIDLMASPVMTATLKLATDSPRLVRGVVHDNQGNPVPFAWLANEQKDKTARVAPTLGEFVLNGLAGSDRTLWVTAPGYWSQPVAIGDRLDIALTPKPDMHTLAWGSGSILVPAQTLADVAGDRVSLKRGWIWGKGTGTFTIHTPDLEIIMQTGAFALEYLPGETNWFYLIDGQAQVRVSDAIQAITMSGNQMLASGKGTTNPTPVALDDAVVRVLHRNEPSQVSIETDLTITARLHDEIERRGISITQAVFLLVGLSVIVVSMVGWRRRKPSA